MKKIISTALVALTFATVSTVDAKATKYQQQQPMTPKQQRRERVERKVVQERVSNPEVKDLDDALGIAIANPTEANKKQVMAALQPATMTDDERELAVLTFQEQDTMNRIGFRRAELKSMSGWFDFIRLSAEQKAAKAEKSKRIRTLISGLEKDLASIKADIASLKPRVSRSWYDTMKTAAKGLGVLGLLGGAIYAIDKYTEGGVGRAYTTGKEYLPSMPSMRRGTAVTE